MKRTDFFLEDLELSDDLKNLPMIAKYDVALQKMISQVFAGEVIKAPYERAFELFINNTKEELKFPFISLFPSGNYTLAGLNNFSSSHVGQAFIVNPQTKVYNDKTLKLEGETRRVQDYVQYLYFDIPYQIECWSTNRIEALQLVQEIVFWLDAQGQVKVNYKEHVMNCNMTLGKDIIDNSAYTEYQNLGNIYRFTLNVVIEAPVFRTVKYLNIDKSDLELNITD